MNFQTRKFFKRAGRILVYPAILVIPFAVVVWLLIPGIHNRYKCELIKTQLVTDDVVCSYVDFNNDGYSEHFFTGLFNGKPFCTLHGRRDAYHQFNFAGKFVPSNRFLCGDINNDLKKELFIFTVDHDSIFINVINPIENEQELIHSKFLTIVQDSEGSTAWDFREPLLQDLNNDGISEVIILLTAGFQKKPRQVFAYDLVNDTILSSPDFGAYGTQINIYTENNKPRIAVSNYASCNYSDTTIEPNDHFSYMIILDEKLCYRYPTKKVKGNFCQYWTNPFYHDGDTMLLMKVFETETEPGWRLTLVDRTGDVVKSKLFKHGEEDYNYFYSLTDRTGNTKILSNYTADQILVFDHNLQVIHKRKIKTERFWNYFPDLDNDGNPELFFNSINPGELIILRHNLKSPVYIKVAANGFVYPINVILKGEEPPYFLLQIDSTLYYYKYFSFTPWIEYGILLLVYLLIFGFTLMISRIQKKQLKKKYETRQTISELKFMSIRNQMDPHFTFNILNTIGSIILQNKPEESYNMLMKYSKLLRSTLASSDTLLGTLEEEINFVTNYLELQKIRFKENLNYTITVSEEVDISTIVPKMVIHTYVENAVKHGIMTLNSIGLIEISISKEHSHIGISVTDNGIGRKKAALKGSESGKGHTIMHQFYALLNEINQGQITVEILDLVDPEGNPDGTEVVVRIPIVLGMK